MAETRILCFLFVLCVNYQNKRHVGNLFHHIKSLTLCDFRLSTCDNGKLNHALPESFYHQWHS